MKRLNLWHRLGIVLSVLWAAGAWLYSYSDQAQQARNLAGTMQMWCLETEQIKARNGSPTNTERCHSGYLESYNRVMAGAANNAWRFALMPIPLFWLLAYVIYWIGRWVLAGRRAAEK